MFSISSFLELLVPVFLLCSSIFTPSPPRSLYFILSSLSFRSLFLPMPSSVSLTLFYLFLRHVSINIHSLISIIFQFMFVLYHFSVFFLLQFYQTHFIIYFSSSFTCICTSNFLFTIFSMVALMIFGPLVSIFIPLTTKFFVLFSCSIYYTLTQTSPNI